MKVLHLSSEKTWRGGEQQIAYLMDELRDTHQVETLAAARANSEFSKRMYQKKHRVVELPFKSELDLYTAYKVKELVNDEKIDIVHMHSGHSHTIGVLSKVLGHDAKLVLSKRTDYPVKDNFFSRWKFNHPAIKRILCVSGKIKEVLKPDIKDFEKVEVVYSGIDMKKFEIENPQNVRDILSLPKDAKIVVNTSAISEQKDIGTFIEVAEKVLPQHPNTYFVLCGDGPLREEMEKRVQDKKLDRFIFMGFRKDLPEFLASADIFLITSQDEGLGTAILDAFANKLPVIATRAGGIPEIVRHNETGLTAEVKDVETLSQEVSSLLSNPESATGLIENAYKLAEEFSYKRTASQTLQIYKSILEN